MDETTTSRATVATATPSKYLQQLCKHFAHKLPVTFDPAAGEVRFDHGTCRLAADQAAGRLEMTVTAGDAESLARLEDVIARHLLRFAFRESPAVAWTRG